MCHLHLGKNFFKLDIVSRRFDCLRKNTMNKHFLVVIVGVVSYSCITDCVLSNAVLQKSLTLIKKYPKTTAALGTICMGLASYSIFYGIREQRIKSAKNMFVDSAKVGIQKAQLYYGEMNISNARIWGKLWSLHQELANINGHAAWRFIDEHGLFDQIIDEKHTYQEISQLRQFLN